MKEKKAEKASVQSQRAAEYRSPKVVTLSSAQILEQLGAAQGYGGCRGGPWHGGGRHRHGGHGGRH
jgi:hypothetical protein